MRQNSAQIAARNEQGGSVVVAIVALPLLLVFLFAVVDLGRMVFLRAEADTAVHAACRYVKEHGGVAAAEDVRAAALQAAPSLEAQGVRLSLKARVGDVQKREGDHQVFDVRTSTFVVRTASMQTRALEVTAEVEALYITPIGAFLDASSTNPSFLCTAQARATMDISVEGGLP